MADRWQKNWQGDWGRSKWDSWGKKDENEKKRKSTSDDATAGDEGASHRDDGPQSSRWKRTGDNHDDDKDDDDSDDDDQAGQERDPQLNSKWSQLATGQGKPGKSGAGQKTHRKRDFQALQRLAGRKVARLEEELTAAKDNAAALEARIVGLNDELRDTKAESAQKLQDMQDELKKTVDDCEKKIDENNKEVRQMRIILGNKSHSEEDMKKNVLTQTELLKSSEDQRLAMQKIMDKQALKIHKHEQALPLWQKKVKQLRKRLEEAEKVINRGRLEKALAEDRSHTMLS